VLGKKCVSMNLVVIAEKQIEAMLFRDAGGAAGTVAPFAEAAGGVAGPLEDRPERLFALAERIEAAVGPDRHVPCVFAREQGAARRGTNGPAGQALREPHA